MAKFEFREKGHKYTVDGTEVPSVSEITRFIAKELYNDVMQVSLDRAADRGSRIHKATEALDKYGEISVTDDIKPYIMAYVAFSKEHQPQWEKIEWSVHKGLEYAGTLDRYGLMDDKHCIVDIKSTKSITKQHKMLYEAAQNLYRMAIESEHPVDAIYLLQLKDDGRYKLIELPIRDELALACLSLHNALKKQKRERRHDDGRKQESGSGE